MENTVIKGIITATSKKQKEGFTQKNPTKTAYITVIDNESRKKLIDLGAREYSSKDDEKFFIIKFSSNAVQYQSPNDLNAKPFELRDLESDNFKTLSPVYLNVIKGQNMGNDFHRVQAILAPDDVIQKIEAENPFKDVQTDDNDMPF